MRHCGRALLPAFSTGGRRVVLGTVGATVVIREARSWSTCGRTLLAGTILLPFARFVTGNARNVGWHSRGCDSSTGRWVDFVTRLSNIKLVPSLLCRIHLPGSCHA
jgi:hypothetical protein